MPLMLRWKRVCCIDISVTADRSLTCIPLNKRWHLIRLRVGLPSTTSLQIRLQRDTLALSLVTGGALWSCNQEPSSWMCSLTMWPYKLRYPLKCEKRRIGTLSGWLDRPVFFIYLFFKSHFSIFLPYVLPLFVSPSPLCNSTVQFCINSHCSTGYAKIRVLFILITSSADM